MKKLIIGSALLALAGAPSLGRAEAPSQPPADAAPAQDPRATEPAPADESQQPADYASREAAAPELGEFAGGVGGGIYIGSGAVILVLVVLLLIVIL
jgi:hypothetical protein